MKAMTVSEVSKAFDISTRMLRYYEKIGLISSCRKEDYAYRIYGNDAVRRLQLIIVLRKLRIPLKKIAIILEDNGGSMALETLDQHIAELDEEINALGIIRSILQTLKENLSNKVQLEACYSLLDDKELAYLSNVLCLSKHKFKEGYLVDNLNAANQSLGKNIDARMFGFNHPNPSEGREHHGYEDWVTIPDDMEVPAPLVKKKFNGGLYAAHTIDFPNFHEWQLLKNWVMENDSCRANYSALGEEIMGGCLEEHLNWIYSSHTGWPERGGIDGKLDLLAPIVMK